LLPRSQFAQPFSEEGKTFHLAVGVKRPTENRESRGKHNFRGTHKRASTSSSSHTIITIGNSTQKTLRAAAKQPNKKQKLERKNQTE